MCVCECVCVFLQQHTNLKFLKFSVINLFFNEETGKLFFFFLRPMCAVFLDFIKVCSFQIKALIPQCNTQERMKEMSSIPAGGEECPRTKDAWDCRERGGRGGSCSDNWGGGMGGSRRSKEDCSVAMATGR